MVSNFEFFEERFSGSFKFWRTCRKVLLFGFQFMPYEVGYDWRNYCKFNVYI